MYHCFCQGFHMESHDKAHNRMMKGSEFGHVIYSVWEELGSSSVLWREKEPSNSSHHACLKGRKHPYELVSEWEP